jgi:hypothetical protein
MHDNRCQVHTHAVSRGSTRPVDLLPRFVQDLLEYALLLDEHLGALLLPPGAAWKVAALVAAAQGAQSARASRPGTVRQAASGVCCSPLASLLNAMQHTARSIKLDARPDVQVAWRKIPMVIWNRHQSKRPTPLLAMTASSFWTRVALHSSTTTGHQVPTTHATSKRKHFCCCATVCRGVVTAAAHCQLAKRDVIAYHALQFSAGCRCKQI